MRTLFISIFPFAVYGITGFIIDGKKYNIKRIYYGNEPEDAG
jgi:hypothetical protein